MHIEQIEYIVEVAKVGSISKAAKNLHVSVSTISQSITSFEERYGVKLFKRSRLGTIPTDQGKKVINKAFEVCLKLMELEKETQSHHDSANNQLSILSSPSILLTYLPDTIPVFQKKYPHIDITIKEHLNILEILKQNETDIGFISLNETHWIEWAAQYKNNFHFDTLSQGRLCVCVSKHSPLSFKDSITPEELLDQNHVVYTSTKHVYEHISEHYRPLKILFDTYNTEILKKSVLSGMAVTLLSDIIMKNDPSVKSGEIILIPLINYERANLTYGIVRSKKRNFSPQARDFIKTMRDQIEQGVTVHR
jgi:LysR family transcriptional regulator, transcription activator of glutamate synthase operon